MPHSSHKAYNLLRLTTDLFLLAICFAFSIFLAERHIGMIPRFLDISGNKLIFLFLQITSWILVSGITRLYEELYFRAFQYELLALLKTTLAQALVAVLFLFMVKEQVLSRYFAGAYILLLLGLMIVGKIVFRGYLTLLRKKGRNLRSVIIAGAGDTGKHLAQFIRALHHLGYRIVGFVDDADQVDPDLQPRFRIGEMEKILTENPIDMVVVAAADLDDPDVFRVLTLCERFPVDLRMIPNFYHFLGTRYEIFNFGPFPFISLRSIPLDQWFWRFYKRGFDLLLSLFLFVLVFSWLWPVMAVLIKLSSAGPVFFKQERWGAKNRRIHCYKFRSMHHGTGDIDRNGDYQQATRNDPRVTRIGRFLRRTNLDELPQFINVIRGDMSVVGPRPHPTPLNLESIDQVQNYLFRHMIKPGITGWAQVNGFRGETREPGLMKKRVEHDIWYIENWSFLLDMKILWLTVKNMIQGDEQAY